MNKKSLIDAAFFLAYVILSVSLVAVYGERAEDAQAENAILRERVQELEARPLTIELTREEPEGAAWQSVGECTVTHYCGCRECCGHTGCITATGTLAVMGRTVGVDPEVIPLGSEVLVNGVVYVAEDTGVRGKAVDIYIESHEQAEQMGTYSALVCWR